MQELLQIIVKRIRAIEDAFHENARAVSRMEARVAMFESREKRANDAPERIAELSRRVEEIAAVLAGLHTGQQALRDAMTERSPVVEQRMQILEERLSNVEGSAGDFRAMADHVIAHEAVLTTLEHQVTQQASTVGGVEEQASAYQSQFEIFDRQLAAHRADMNAIDERARSLEERFAALPDDAPASADLENLAERIAWLEQMQSEMAQRLAPPEELTAKLEPVVERVDAAIARLDATEAGIDAVDRRGAALEQRLDGIDGRLDTTDARFASLSERIAALHNLHNDVVANADLIASLRASLDEVTGERLDAILERLDGVDRLAADVASHAGQLATIRGRQADAPSSPIVVAAEESPETRTRVDALAVHVDELRRSATMLDSIRTLLAASDVQKMLDEMQERLARLDAQVATLFTLQRMTSEGDAEQGPSVLTLEQERQ